MIGNTPFLNRNQSVSRSSRRLAVSCLLGVIIHAASSAVAAILNVDSIAALQTKIGTAAPGDTIVVKSGRYTTTAALMVTRVGTKDAPITIKAETVGGVEIA